MVGKPNLSDLFKMIIKQYEIVGYNMNSMQESAHRLKCDHGLYDGAT